MADTQTQSEDVVVPSMSLMDQITADTQAALVQSSSAQRQIMANTGVAASLTENIVKAQEGTAADKAVVASAAEAADLKAQQYRIQAANRAGVDPTKASDFMLETIDKFTAASKKAQERQAIVNEKRDSKFTDDPLKWLVDGLTLPAAQTDLRLSQEETTLYATQIAQTNNLISATSDTSLKIRESKTQASVEAATRIAATDAQIAAYQAQLEGVKYNSAAIDRVQGVTKEQLGMVYNQNSAKQQAKAQEIVLEKFEEEKKQFRERQDYKAEADKDKTDAKAMDEDVLNKINLGRAARGAAPITGLEAKNKIAIFRSKGPGSEELGVDYLAGERTQQIGVTSYASSPADFLESSSKVNRQPVPAQSRVYDVITSAAAALQNDPKMAGVKDEATRARYINEFVKASVTAQYNAKEKTPDNIFYVGDVSNYFDVSTVGNLPIVKKVLKPATEAGVRLDDPMRVIDLGISAVKAGQITSTEFADISAMYQMANMINLQSVNLLGYGISTPNAGRNYYVKGGSATKPFDITDSTQLLRFFSTRSAASSATDVLTGFEGAVPTATLPKQNAFSR